MKTTVAINVSCPFVAAFAFSDISVLLLYMTNCVPLIMLEQKASLIILHRDDEKQRLHSEIEMTKRMQRQAAVTATMVANMQPRLSSSLVGTKVEEHMMTGGFTENDIQNLTSQNRFMTEESVDLAESADTEMTEPSRRSPVAIRSSLGGDKLNRQRGIMKKTQSLEVSDGVEVSLPVNATNQYVQATSKRMHRSSSENRLAPER